MRFLSTIFGFSVIFLLFACQNDSAGEQAAAKSATDTTAAVVVTDTVLISLPAKDFHQVLIDKRNTALLDVRPPEAFKSGHMYRAMNYPVTDSLYLHRIASLGRTNEYAVYCQDGSASLETARQMKALGFKRIYHLEGGLNTWGVTGQALQIK